METAFIVLLHLRGRVVVSLLQVQQQLSLSFFLVQVVLVGRLVLQATHGAPNFGQGGFTGAVPSGYTAGWPSVASTTVASPTLTLTTSGWLWALRMDLVDPNTSAAWTVAAVNVAQIGPVVIA